jgi:hypothetical protein
MPAAAVPPADAAPLTTLADVHSVETPIVKAK